MSKIFISYRRDDSAGYVGRLYDRLVEHYGSDQIFMDIDAIEPGVDFVDVIEDALSACKVALIIIGKVWTTITEDGQHRRIDNPSDFVRLEVASALQRDIRVIPVLVRDASMPRLEELPGDLHPLLRRNAVQLDDRNFHHDVDRLIETLDRILEPVKSRMPTPAKATPIELPATSKVQNQPISRPSKSVPWVGLFSVILPALFIGGIGGAAFGIAANIANETDNTMWLVVVFALTWSIYGIALAGALRSLSTEKSRKGASSIGWLGYGILGPLASLRILRRASVGWFGILIALGGIVIAIVVGYFPAVAIANSYLEYATYDDSMANLAGFAVWGLTTGVVHSLVNFATLKLFRRVSTHSL